MCSDKNSRVLHYQGHAVACRDHETALDALLRAGAPIPFSCKSGVCHRCMVLCLDGDVPEDARRKLPEHRRAQGCLLACQCRPAGPMRLAPPPGEQDVHPRGPHEARTLLPPDPALWDELGGDATVRAVLTTFYNRVYADADLRPFFERVTLDRIIGKQFAFLKENIQGLPVFLGEQPGNSHNWMVISDALFDHRQHLMLAAMREHGIAEDLIARWSRYEEQFRPDIVKDKPWLKRVGDLLVDTEQYETCLLEEATVCDYCGDEIPVNTMVRYHKRIGRLGCEACTASAAADGEH